MALFRNSQKDKIIKYFKENKVTYNELDNKIETEIIFSSKNISLYPYFIIDDENNYFSIIINIKKINEKKSADIYQKINDFNLISQYFVAKISNDNILYLEYNTIYSDNLKDIYETSIGSINNLLDYIENF